MLFLHILGCLISLLDTRAGLENWNNYRRGTEFTNRAIVGRHDRRDPRELTSLEDVPTLIL
jgi:hypothetical protein